MTITNLWWEEEGHDIHLLRGESSIPLAGKLRASRNNLSSQFSGTNPPSGVTVEFLAEFKGAPSNHGVTVSSTGQVTITSLPTPRLYNFIVRAVVREVGSNSLDIPIRIHIHDTIRKIWLTPGTLTLYVASGEQRFTVLAEFDDGTFGDITNRNSTVVLNNSNRLTFMRLPGPLANITVDANTGKVTALQENVEQEVRVSIPLGATTPELPDEQQSGATVKTKPTLNRPRALTRVRGLGPVSFSTKANILFLPDGFQIGERELFNQIVDRIVKKLQDDDSTYPYKALRGSINYWRLADPDFFPSQEQNVSLLAELDLVGRRTSSGRLVPFPVKPPASATFWKLEHLVYMVGLPVPSDTRTVAQLQTLYDGIFESKIKSRTFNEWIALGDRKLVNERDTAFGIALNDHPRVDLDADRFATFHERRTTASRFMAMVDALQHGGTTVGPTWVSGKDKGLICLVARSECDGGTNAEVFCFTLGERQENKLQLATSGRGIDLIPMKLADTDGKLIDFDPGVVLTVAHECAHAFGLSDEYGGGFQYPAQRKAHLLGVGNVQPASEIRNGLSGTIDSQGIRWNLPRIKAAGVLGGPPTASGANLTVTLATVRTGDFAKDDIVRFRKRDFLAGTALDSGPFLVHDAQPDQVSINPFSGTVITAGDFPAGTQLIATRGGAIGSLTSEPSSSMFGGDVLDVQVRSGQGAHFDVGNAVVLRKSPFSGRFKVAADPVGNQLTIAPLAGTGTPASLFIAGDLLVATVPSSLSPLGEDLSLIAPKILARIGSSRGPLNAPSATPTRACVAAPSSGSLMTPTNLPTGLPRGRPANKANIVGLYDGGDGFDCGVFHPAGLCLMRTYATARTARFCHVCRYLIIDRVDPLLHKELDELYKAEYPEP